MTAEATTIPFDRDVALTYAFYGAILGAKMLVVALLTSRQRFKKKVSVAFTYFGKLWQKRFSSSWQVFLNPEDSKLYGGESEKDSDVERVRRAHLNDMENIYLFFFLSAFYLMTGPNPLIAVNLVRVFAVSRIFHTVCYLCEVKIRLNSIPWENVFFW